MEKNNSQYSQVIRSIINKGQLKQGFLVDEIYIVNIAEIHSISYSLKINESTTTDTNKGIDLFYQDPNCLS